MFAGRSVHISGVAGIGMSAVAQVLLDAGAKVSGSDRFLDQGESLETLERLRRAGVALLPQDGLAITPQTAALVVSTAIESDNPEVQAAKRHGVEIVHRAAMLAELLKNRPAIAVTGTSGKTTITAMLGHMLAETGRDPMVINGGITPGWVREDRVGNVRSGAGEWCVFEADESDRSLLQFHPEHAILANVSKDHFELDEVKRLFRAFAGQVRNGRVLGPGVAEVLGVEEPAPQATYVRAKSGWSFDDGTVHGELIVPGRHNAENALLAARMAHRLGVEPEAIARAIATFTGVHRRLERVDANGAVAVYDDYAHNPEKIRASWQAIGENARRVFGYWKPHGFGPLQLMKDEVADALAAAMKPDDRLFILPVFYVGGTAGSEFTSGDFARLLVSRGLHAAHVESYDDLERRLIDIAQPGDAILGMGARDPELPRFARRVAGRLKT